MGTAGQHGGEAEREDLATGYDSEGHGGHRFFAKMALLSKSPSRRSPPGSIGVFFIGRSSSGPRICFL
jgi:hypothetical protein